MNRKIITFFYSLCLIFALTGCSQSSWLYRVNVQQGNIITTEMVKQIKVGMPKAAVYDLLGAPLLVDTFNQDRWTYVYTYKPSRGKYIERQLIIYFRNGHVIGFNNRNIP